jgi:hypothetical protein
MGMLQVHSDALDSSNTAYHEFLLYFKATDRVVYGFVEGKEDPMFYRGMIEQHLPAGWDVELIKSGNKDKVFKVYDEMDWTRFSKNQICFFVDRDLSEFLGEKIPSLKNIYITENYSIENEIVTFGTMKRVLEEVLNITELEKPEIENVKACFESNHGTFREEMATVMSQIVQWKRNGKKPSLNDIQPKAIFEFKDCRIALKDDCKDKRTLLNNVASCVNITPSALDELAKVEVEFHEMNGVGKFIRGKYLLWFFVETALEIHRNISKFCKKHTTAPKVRLALGVGNAMVVIAPRVRCPDSLRGFIESNYGEYIKEMLAA